MLGKIFKKDNKSDLPFKPEPMLALSISAGIVKATVWELRENIVEITGLGTKVYSEAGNEKGVDYKTLLEKTADAIDIACQVAETDVKKTIFGLPQVWIKEEQLLPEYDALMEKLAKTLDLESVAYVSIPHAISYYLQYLHKTPTTAIMIGSSREGAHLSYVENGKIKENHYIAWAGGSLGRNIEKGLAQFTTIKQLPPIICLYGYGDLNAAKNELGKFQWSSDANAPTFVSSPKIIQLEEHVDALSVSLVGAKDYAKQNGIQGRLEIKSLEYAALNSDALAIEENILPAVPEKKETHLAKSDLDIFKPSEEKTNPKEESDTMHAHPEIQPPKSTPDPVPFGFVVNSDIANEEEEIESQPSDHTTDIAHGSIQQLHDQAAQNDDASDEKESEEEAVMHSWHDNEPANPDWERPWEQDKIQDMKSNKKFSMSKITLSNPLRGKRMKGVLVGGGVIAVVLVLLSAGAAWAYWNLPKAKVTVYVKPEELPKQFTVKASESAQLSTTDYTIPAKKISIDIKESKTADTTGKRQIGEAAKGEVTITNKTGSSKTFTAGSELRAGNKKFTLVENVTVASASAETTDAGETKTYGKSTVKATAVEIGPDGNITKDTSLSIPPFTTDDYEAKAAANFTGGIKKDVQVVSATDRTNVAKDLRSDLQMKIGTALREKVSGDDILLDNAWQQGTTTEKFNKNVNDESATITVEITMKINGYLFNKNDVEKILANSSEAAVPDGYDLKDHNKTTKTEFVSLDKNGLLTLNATTVETIIPKINEGDIARSIIGKREQAAIETIKANSKVFDVTIEYSVTLPAFLQTLPHQEKNIEVKRGVR